MSSSKKKKKDINTISSLINIASPLLYLYLVFSTMFLVWILAYFIAHKVLCNTIFANSFACEIPKHSWDDSQFIIWFFCVILPAWILTWVFWFFVIKKINIKTKKIISWDQKINKKISIINIITIIIALPVAILLWQIIDNWHKLTLNDFFSFYVPLWIIISTLFIILVNSILKRK